MIEEPYFALSKAKEKERHFIEDILFPHKKEWGLYPSPLFPILHYSRKLEDNPIFFS
jgi:hypothetical protein